MAYPQQVWICTQSVLIYSNKNTSELILIYSGNHVKKVTLFSAYVRPTDAATYFQSWRIGRGLAPSPTPLSAPWAVCPPARDGHGTRGPWWADVYAQPGLSAVRWSPSGANRISATRRVPGPASPHILPGRYPPPWVTCLLPLPSPPRNHQDLPPCPWNSLLLTCRVSILFNFFPKNSLPSLSTWKWFIFSCDCNKLWCYFPGMSGTLPQGAPPPPQGQVPGQPQQQYMGAPQGQYAPPGGQAPHPAGQMAPSGGQAPPPGAAMPHHDEGQQLICFDWGQYAWMYLIYKYLFL